MIITLKSGDKKEYSESKSVYEIAADISEGLARAACAGEVDGETVDLRTIIDRDCDAWQSTVPVPSTVHFTSLAMSEPARIEPVPVQLSLAMSHLPLTVTDPWPSLHATST